MSSESQEAEMPPFPGRIIHFANFNVTGQVFHLTSHCFAVVNIKPLLPGHILVCPLRVQPQLADLSREEISDIFNTVTRVQRTLKRVYKADAFNVAVQDGEAAGQSVPHMHCHVIPRHHQDEAGDDKIHQWLEGEESNVGAHQKEAEDSYGKKERKVEEWPKDEDRKPRSKEEMNKEAQWLREEMAKDEQEGGKL